MFLRIIIDGKRTKISTGEKIHPKFWNIEKQEAP
ncbi:MAG: hypothetical protein EPN82_02310 [Bacteroidetes bacterium]|nr:MAG: hypothetical protein EPN82_02310 [Bacteroidota bacterium]